MSFSTHRYAATSSQRATSRGAASQRTTPQRRRSRRVAPSIPLGSLTQAELRVQASCTVCGSDRVTRLSMKLTDGTPVAFTSCHRCEHRSWRNEDDALSVADVLHRTRKTA